VRAAAVRLFELICRTFRQFSRHKSCAAKISLRARENFVRRQNCRAQFSQCAIFAAHNFLSAQFSQCAIFAARNFRSAQFSQRTIFAAHNFHSAQFSQRATFAARNFRSAQFSRRAISAAHDLCRENRRKARQISSKRRTAAARTSNFGNLYRRAKKARTPVHNVQACEKFSHHCTFSLIWMLWCKLKKALAFAVTFTIFHQQGLI
jgi:hypothetical protein